ncbi:hypothetical protein K3172_12915 [Qipengyuania sp. 6B39]|uniref:hypothetical protein n=1 Tax=Qipengyuania proteolytica TaxID=2867239 RepID=UPI001C89C6D1|nr:hypothetical protein [Qipengyuania proteolytica]MBX7496760.1 hypothetical protein [Qipengyuania proteolytica]
MFAVIVGARMKASVELATMIGWSAERFAREKRLKSLDDYLKPAKPKTPESGALDVRRMFDRMIKRQGDQNGTR